MNAKTSLIVWIISIAFAAACFWGFAHGAELKETSLGAGLGWMLGSVAGLILMVLVKVKWLR